MEKRINIYLSNIAKKKLNEVKFKYHLSYSTIINILVAKYYMVLGDFLTDHYLNDKKGTKTSIKPKNEMKFNKKISIMYTNAVEIWATGTLKNYVEDKHKLELINNYIYSEFQNTYEENWDGNRLQKLMPKMIKQNRSYYRRLLDE